MHRLRHNLRRLHALWLQYEYKHTTLAVLAAILFIALLDTTVVSGLLSLVENLGYFSAFIAGLLSVSFFTTAPSIVLLVELAGQLDPIALAIVAGAGGMVGDWLILLFFEERIIRELRPLLVKLRIAKIITYLRRRSLSWILILAGAISLATPIPDEIGVALLGVGHIKRTHLFIICFALNTLGILSIALLARAL